MFEGTFSLDSVQDICSPDYGCVNKVADFLRDICPPEKTASILVLMRVRLISLTCLHLVTDCLQVQCTLRSRRLRLGALFSLGVTRSMYNSFLHLVYNP